MKFEKISRCATYWREIFNRTPSASPFISFDWLSALSEHLLKEDPDVIIFMKNNIPVGAIPATTENHTLKFLSDERVTDIADMLFLPNHEYRIIEKLAAFIETEGLRINLAPLETTSPLIQHLPDLVDEVTVERADLCPILNLPNTWEEYLGKLDGKWRHELRRKLRKATEVSVENLDHEHIDILFELMASSDANKKEFLITEIRSFFRAVAASFDKNQWLRFRATFLDSKPIGVTFSFQMATYVYLYNSGFDPDFNTLSPGIVTISQDIMSAIQEGVTHYDFLRGSEDYKFHFGAEERYTMRITR